MTIKNFSDDWVTYKYSWRFLPAAFLLIFTPFVTSLGVIWILREGWQGGSAFLLFSLSFVLLIGWTLLLGLSDISINDEEICRTAFGITWQKMKWSDVIRLRISQSRNPQDGKLTRSYVLVSAKGRGTFFSRRITFQERAVGMNELLNKMKICLAQHNVSITDVSTQ